MSFSCVPFVKTVKNAKFYIISDFKHVFLVFGGLVTKNAFSKINPVFWDNSFDTQLILSQHPQQVFCNFHHPFSHKFGKLITFSNIWMFRHNNWNFGKFLMKIGGEFICQSWPPHTPFLQLSHSALVASIWLFLQIGCPRGCKVTFLALVWNFTPVRFQMCP